MVTLGQYLRPTPNHLSVERYVTPSEFEKYRQIGLKMGFLEVVSGPLVRSSYRADKVLQKNKLGVLIKQINQIIKENDIKGIIIGNPINMDGTSGKSSQSASDFAKNLSKNITIPIAMWDERLSSEGSFKITKELGTNVSNRVNKLDKNAAAFILQGAIDYLSN